MTDEKLEPTIRGKAWGGATIKAAAENLEVQLAAKLTKEQEFMEQTVKAIAYHEQNKLEGTHVQYIIDLLHKSYAESQKLINKLTQPTTTNKYGKPYMEK